MNGGEAHYGVDTGADLSTISEAEASRLGLQVHEAPGFRWKDGFGHAIAARIALADELVLGDFRLNNVLSLSCANRRHGPHCLSRARERSAETF